MFYWFLRDYEVNVYKADERKLKALYNWEKGLLISLITLGVATIFAILYFRVSLISMILLLLMLLFLAIINILEDKRQKRELSNIIENFKTNKLNPLINLLQDQKYSFSGKLLNSKDEIDWLLKTCATEIEKKKSRPHLFTFIKDLFLMIILPLASFAGGTFASTLTNSEKIYFSIMAIAILFMIIGLYCMIAPSVNEIMMKQIKVIEDLRNNLEFYKMIQYGYE